MCTSVSIKRNEARASHCVERDGFTRNGIALAGVDAHELCAPSGKKWIGMFIYPDGQWNVPEPHAFKALSLAGFRARRRLSVLPYLSAARRKSCIYAGGAGAFRNAFDFCADAHTRYTLGGVSGCSA